MSRLALISLLIAISFGSQAEAHELITSRVIWTQHISRIFYKRCVSCHREGGSSFPLTRFREARPWAKSIKNQILRRRMPPTKKLAIQGVVRLDEPVQALGILPESIPEGDSLEVIAKAPDGSTQYLIWVREYRKRWQRSYYFREPVDLPAGTQLFVRPTTGAAAFLLTAVPSPAP